MVMKNGSANWNRWCGSAVFPTFGSVGFYKKGGKGTTVAGRAKCRIASEKQQAEEEAERYRTSLVKRYKNSPVDKGNPKDHLRRDGAQSGGDRHRQKWCLRTYRRDGAQL